MRRAAEIGCTRLLLISHVQHPILDLIFEFAAEDMEGSEAGPTGTFRPPKAPKMTRFEEGEPTIDLAAQAGGHEALRNATAAANRRKSLPSGEKRMPTVRTPGPVAARAALASQAPMEEDDDEDGHASGQQGVSQLRPTPASAKRQLIMASSSSSSSSAGTSVQPAMEGQGEEEGDDEDEEESHAPAARRESFSRSKSQMVRLRELSKASQVSSVLYSAPKGNAVPFYGSVCLGPSQVSPASRFSCFCCRVQIESN